MPSTCITPVNFCHNQYCAIIEPHPFPNEEPFPSYNPFLLFLSSSLPYPTPFLIRNPLPSYNPSLLFLSSSLPYPTPFLIRNPFPSYNPSLLFLSSSIPYPLYGGQDQFLHRALSFVSSFLVLSTLPSQTCICTAAFWARRFKRRSFLAITLHLTGQYGG
jgi:hypothetical protein